MNTRMITAALTAAVLAIGLTACSSGGSPDSDEKAGASSDKLYERTITLTDGRVITCVVYSRYQAGGVSCDWGDR